MCPPLRLELILKLQWLSVDLDTLTPLTNADTKVGMRLLVTMTPAHPHWWDEEHKAYTCWLPELERVGMKGDQVRY